MTLWMDLYHEVHEVLCSPFSSLNMNEKFVIITMISMSQRATNKTRDYHDDLNQSVLVLSILFHQGLSVYLQMAISVSLKETDLTACH